MSDEQTYYLPETRVRFTASVTTTTDALAGGEPSMELDDPEFAFESWRDDQAPRTVRLDAGAWRDLDISVGFSDDRRLTSFDGTSTGRAGDVIKAAVSLASIGAGFAVGGPAAAGAAAVARKRDPATSEPGETPWDLYAKAHPTAAERLLAYTRLRDEATAALLEARAGVLRAIKADQGWREAERKVTALTRLLAETDVEVARLTALFDAWRKSKQSRTEAIVNALWEMRHLPRITDQELDWESAADTDIDPTAKSVWDTYGVALARDESHALSGPAEIVHGDPGSDDGIWVRHPRLAVLRVVHRAPGSSLRIERTERRLVMDDRCTNEFLPFDKPFFGKRSLTLQFSDIGALTGIKESRSGAGDVAGTIAGLPGTVAGGLETASKLLTTVDTLRARDDTAAIAALKRQVERKTEALNLKGLRATEADFGELERLKQMVEMVTARQALSGAGAALLTGLVPTDVGEAPAWFAPPPPVQITITVPEGAKADEL